MAILAKREVVKREKIEKTLWLTATEFTREE